MLKIIHWLPAGALLGFGLLALLVFVATALYEVATASRVPGGQRVLWMMVLLVGGSLGWLLYLTLGRAQFAISPLR